MKINYYATTCKGPVREANEDSILIGDLLINFEDHYEMESIMEINITDQPVWFAVADGMGGHESGEVASRIALEKLRNVFTAESSELIKNLEKLREVIAQIHSEVNLYGESAGNKGMGTTLAGVLFNSEKFLLYNVGDSRVYFFRNGFLQQKTRDHTLKEQTGLDVAGNIIVSSIGGGKDDIMIDIYDLTGQIKYNDLLIICSDGLTDIDIVNYYDEFEDLIGQNISDIRILCKNLYIYSIEKYSSDNISIIVIVFVA